MRSWREIDHARFLEYGLRFANSKRMDMAHSCAIATCYGPSLNEPCSEDAEIVAQLAKRSEAEVLVRVFDGIARLGKVPEFQSAALQIALTVDLPDDAKVVDEYCEIFSARGMNPNTLGKDTTHKILKKIVPTRHLDGHNAGAFLHWASGAHPASEGTRPARRRTRGGSRSPSWRPTRSSRCFRPRRPTSWQRLP